MSDKERTVQRAETLDRRAQAIMDTLIVVRGLSYVDAIREAERLAAPYIAVADRLRAELEAHG